MARLFISLYLFIVLSLVGLAALLDQVFFASDNTTDPWITASAALLSSPEEQSPEHQLTRAGLVVRWMEADSIAWPDDMQKRLQQGKSVILHDPNYGQQVYKLYPDNQLMQVYSPDNRTADFWLYSSVFFGLLAALLSLWIWPLWRDLLKLKKASSSLQQDGSLPALSVNPASALAGIMGSFNQLSIQIKSLLQRQRELTGAVAHELRTPLSRLKFALAAEPQPGSSPWQDMNRDVAELESLIQEMLDYASMEHTAPEMDYSVLPLNELIDSVIGRLRSPENENIDIDVQTTHVELLGDGYFVQRALQNVLQNALRYARHRISVSIEKSSDSITILVDDDGPGVAEEDRERIFEPFFRPDNSRARKRGGAGLGLAIVSRIQQWHEGRCEVQRSPSGGARFMLSYPTRYQELQ
ncbi:ATP-binding protein [Lacimicrobium alkaliphilum]|uniref:histidine kinase n=1 Tax=Lacimicrobium alkaliphilum TaxID=1526571 RepID=A0ABQ1RLF1_9ALTE|nr:ATP-binding protein [Lacimicrobium alkaliphilum]GGD70290.1 two-component sensor histidine kinase [Lacimicrobium alkaliphilum]